MALYLTPTTQTPQSPLRRAFNGTKIFSETRSNDIGLGLGRRLRTCHVFWTAIKQTPTQLSEVRT